MRRSFAVNKSRTASEGDDLESTPRGNIKLMDHGELQPASNMRYAWYVVAVLTLANVAAFVDRQIMSLLVVPIRRDLAISDTQMSLLMGLSFSLFYTVLGLPIGRLA